MSASSSSSGSLFDLRTTLSASSAVRIGLAFTNIQDLLQHDHLLSSPLTSHLRLREGLFLFKNNIDPYSGGLFRHSPLYLSLFSTLIPNSRIICSLLWAFGDLLGAWALVQIWRSRQRVQSSSRDSLIAISYLLNPYIFLPSIALSTSSIDNTIVLICVMLASKRLRSPALLTLAFVVNLSIPSLLIIPPVVLLLLCPTGSVSQLASPHALEANLRKNVLPLLVEFAAYFTLLLGAGSLISGGFHWIPQTWGANLILPDLTPNAGLWWYFFTEMFDHFRPFFLMVFSVHLLIYVAPFCIKFQYDPLYATFLLIGILGTFKAYPTLSDPGLFLSMISLFPEINPYLRYPIVSSFLHIHASLLLPLFNHLWLAQGTGNANFFYASTLVFACANGAALMDCLWAGLRIAIGPDSSSGENAELQRQGTGEVAEEKEEWAVTQE